MAKKGEKRKGTPNLNRKEKEKGEKIRNVTSRVKRSRKNKKWRKREIF